MKILVTGANGFIGKNLVLRLSEQAGTEVLTFERGDTDAALQAALSVADAVIHLAGENRPASPDAFELVNAGLTRRVCDGLRAMGCPCCWLHPPKPHWIIPMAAASWLQSKP